MLLPRRTPGLGALCGPIGVALFAAACRGADVTVATAELGPAICSLEVGAEPTVTMLPGERAAVVLMGETSLIVVDSLCHTVATLGREGAGPGEYRFASQAFVDSAGGLHVLDQVLHRVTHYDASLNYVGETPVVGAANIATLALSRDGNVLFTAPVEGVEDTVALTVQRSLTNTARLTWMRLHRPARVMVPIGEIALNTPPEYAAFDAWGALPGGLAWVARGADNSLSEYTGGASRSGPAVAFDRIATVAADRDRWRGLPAPERFRVETRPLAPAKAPFQGVLRADDGEYWMWLNQPAGYTSEHYACRTLESMELLRITLPNAHKVVALGPTRVLLYGEDADGTPMLSSHARVRCSSVPRS